MASDRSVSGTRRGFLKRVITGLLSLRAARVIAVPITAAAAAGSQSTYLEPRYLPFGYKPFARFWDRPDGFLGGATELALWFSNTTNPAGSNRPLAIYQAVRPSKQQLGANERRSGKAISINRRDGATLSARYYDGIWTRSPNGPVVWDATDAHSLVFNVGGLLVGIRGARQAGVDYTELTAVASALA